MGMDAPGRARPLPASLAGTNQPRGAAGAWPGQRPGRRLPPAPSSPVRNHESGIFALTPPDSSATLISAPQSRAPGPSLGALAPGSVLGAARCKWVSSTRDRGRLGRAESRHSICGRPAGQSACRARLARRRWPRRVRR